MSDWIEITGNTDIGDLPDHLMTDLGLLRSRFLATAWPANPAPGQPCVRSDRGYRAYTYTNDPLQGEAGWVEDALLSATVLALKAELEASRGTAANLGARLSVAMNPDGSLKDPAPAGSWWATEADDVAYASAATFTVEGDKTGVYTAGRALHLVQTASGYGYVVSSTYASGTGLTTVTVRGVAVDSGLFGVEYGQPAASAPGAIAGKPVPVADVADALKFLCVLADGSGYELAGRIVTDTVAKQLASTTGLLTPANEKAIIADHGGWPGFKSLIINSNMQVAQRAAASLSTAWQFGKVDRFAVRSTQTPTSGTITQQTGVSDTICKGAPLSIQNISLPGGSLQIRTRLEAKDVYHLYSGLASLPFRIYHNFGSTVDTTVYINAATAGSDNWTSQATRDSRAIQLATGWSTPLVNSLSCGECRSGVEVLIDIACGACSGKQVDLMWLQLEAGSICTVPEFRPLAAELAMCQRYFDKSYNLADAPGTVTLNGCLEQTYRGSNRFYEQAIEKYKQRMRTSPTVTVYSPQTGAGGKCSDLTNDYTATVQNLSERGFFIICGYPTANTEIYWHWAADAEL